MSFTGVNMSFNELKSALQKDASEFTGDKAKFWSGKMSVYITAMQSANLLHVSSHMEILVFCKDEYDHIIFSRT